MKLSEGNIYTLNSARKVLQQIENDAVGVFHDLDGSERNDLGKVDGHDLGRISEAASVAEVAIFNVLNTLNAYGKANLTYEQLHGRPESVEEVEA